MTALRASEVKEIVTAAQEDGTLAGLLDKHRIHNLVVLRVSENSNGMRRWAISERQYERLDGVYQDLGLGELKEYMRSFRTHESDYTVRFSTGCGYSIFDSDLLGGDMSGRVQEAFANAGLVID